MFQRFSFSPDDDIISRTRWYIHFRWFYILALSIPAALSLYFAKERNEELGIVGVAVSLALVSNAVFYMLTRFFTRSRLFQALATSLLITDIMINNYLILMNGGIESRTTILYVIPIMMSASIFKRRGIYAAAGLCLVSYAAIILADYFDVYRSYGEVNLGLHAHLSEIIYLTVFFTMSLVAVAIATDFITKLLRQKEQQALETIEDLKRAQAIGKFGSWEWDIPGNRIVWSDEMYHLLGLPYEPGELSFERFISFVHRTDRRKVMSEIKRAGKRPVRFGFDCRLVLVDGTEKYMRTEGESMADKSGRVETIIGTAHDITEERRLDETKNEFVSLASHQLRTPTTVVKQYLNMLLDGYAGELTDKQRNFIQIASDTNDHQITIVNSLLGVAQLESGKIQLTMTDVDLVGFIRALVDEYAPRARSKDQTISFSTRFKRLYCYVDERSLRTVLENLLDNAFKYTMPGKAITLRLTKEVNSAIISVADQGVGIAHDDLPKLFKKFSRIEHPETFKEVGAGLGLYWAEKIVMLHNGKIDIQSELGKGTTVKVSLPIRRSAKRTRLRSKRTVGALAA